eukprot:CAMPEP_0115007388 /NCGR_PEP_ID=MMETSP0216-20121206/21143_1 /TAXON_ID=223996 /ORGANISM="Protocruzia adherens, Strain Boccale" /LENGTH=135 /DNA_ID=CAMNT_0002374307 /DNA_START=53 /DNA_END=460 /DNA_ORIENTATION=-
MGFRRYVQIGRAVHINYGPEAGKLAVILDIIDNNRVLVEGPTSGVERQQMPLKRVVLTSFVVPIQRGFRSGNLKKAIEDFGLDKKFAESKWGKGLAQRELRAGLTDYQRFELMVLRKQKAYLLKRAVAKAKKAGQ